MIRICCLFGVFGLGALLDWTQARGVSTGLVSSAPQAESFEKQALSLAQRILASDLDADLPKSSFVTWFKQIIGPQAGMVWQLTECGERIAATDGAGQDFPACAEVIASLPDGRKVIVVISVGTFKKGLSGEPTLFGAFLESNDQLNQIRRLQDLPTMMSPPKTPSVSMPAISVDLAPIKLSSHRAYLSLQSLNITSAPMRLIEMGNPPPPPPPPKPQTPPPRPPQPQKVLEGVLVGNAITKANPVYPANARSMNAFGPVEVQLTISEDGRVIDAKAVSGHPALRNAALEAARKWIFKPTMLNGAPVKVQGILTFVFTQGAQ